MGDAPEPDTTGESMSITRRTDYAVRIMYELAQLPHGASLSLRDVCALADVPESFGATIAAFLAEAALISTSGYNSKLLSLARSAEQINMAEIVYACEPEFSLSECSRNLDVCARSARCGVHMMWEELDAIMVDHLMSVSLARVARGTRATGPMIVDLPASRLLPQISIPKTDEKVTC